MVRPGFRWQVHLAAKLPTPFQADELLQGQGPEFHLLWGKKGHHLGDLYDLIFVYIYICVLYVCVCKLIYTFTHMYIV